MSEESDRISFFPSYHTWQIYAWFMLNSNGLIWVYYIYAGKIIREIEIDNLILLYPNSYIQHIGMCIKEIVEFPLGSPYK